MTVTKEQLLINKFYPEYRRGYVDASKGLLKAPVALSFYAARAYRCGTEHYFQGIKKYIEDR